MDHFYKKIHGWFNFSDLYRSIIAKMPEDFKFAEVGVWKGQSISYFVVEAINSQKPFELYAIDTFDGRGTMRDSLLKMKDGLYDHFMKNIEHVKDHIKVIRNTSVNAAKEFPDNYFDAVFIDASHDFNSVLNDLHAWLPKVKNNSLYGHDLDKTGVKKALEEFTKEKSLKFKKTSRNCWMLVPHVS